VPTDFGRNSFIYGKDKLVESVEERVDVSKRQTKAVLEFKTQKQLSHNISHSK
jgi:NADH-quinone oxidoreductase subunit I